MRFCFYLTRSDKIIEFFILSPPTDNHTKSEADFEARILALEERVHSCENKLRMYEQLFGNLLEQGLKNGFLSVKAGLRL